MSSNHHTKGLEQYSLAGYISGSPQGHLQVITLLAKLLTYVPFGVVAMETLSIVVKWFYFSFWSIPCTRNGI